MIEREQLRQIFRDRLDPDHDPLEFQYKTAEHLLAGRSVILQAPTGAGKTQAALLPFVAARERNISFPRQMMHAAPMRVLVDNFYDKAIQLGLNKTLGIETRRQTGEARDDPKLESDLIYLTIDQLLSSFLGIPFSLSKRQANINSGAVIGSYIIIDEFHLLDPDTSLATTIQMLCWLNGITPFLLMTATLSDKMLKELQEGLNPEHDPKREVSIVQVSATDLEKIPSQADKVRTFHAADQHLTAEAVLDKHRGRSIVVCNTIDRAQQIYRDLLADKRRTKRNTLLLHSRFLTKRRAKKTAKLLRQLGKDAWGEKQRRHNFILVATQVIEVGIDISSEVLHTEVAPASAILQRAGRCARFAKQHGDVYVYPPTNNHKGKPNYAPYFGKTQKRLCELTLDGVRSRNNDNLNFAAEAALVNEVHAEADSAMMERLRSSEISRNAEILHTIQQAEVANARRLIRDNDSVTLIVHPAPDSDQQALRRATFSLPFGTVRKLLREVSLSDENSWCLRYYRERQPLGEMETYVKIEWPIVKSAAELFLSPILCLNPRFVSYSRAIGLRLRPSGDAPNTSKQTPYKDRKSAGDWQPNTITRETYEEHIKNAIAAFDQDLIGGLLYAAPRIESDLGLKPGTIIGLARLTLVMHDLGKLSLKWQEEAHGWQTRIEDNVPTSMMLAHTYLDDKLILHQQTVRPKFPHHAAEGALLANILLRQILQNEGYSDKIIGQLLRPVVTAIAKHHSPTTRNCTPFRLHSGAFAAIDAVGKLIADLPFTSAALLGVNMPDSEVDLAAKAFVHDHKNDMILYALFVRALRLADQQAMNLAHRLDQ